IAGKTGTAQTAAGGGYTHSYRATFVGFFPVEAPEVALIVVLDGPQNGYYGGSVSAPIFGAIARRRTGTFPSIAARVAPAAPLPERAEAPVPDVDGMPAVLAEGRLLARGFPVRADDDAPWAPVAEQDPAPGDRADVRHAVRLVAAPAGVSAGPSSARPASAPAGAAMPDLRGLPARPAAAAPGRAARSRGAPPSAAGRGWWVAGPCPPSRPRPAARCRRRPCARSSRAVGAPRSFPFEPDVPPAPLAGLLAPLRAAGL